MAISAITLAELMHGAKKSSDPVRNLAVVEDFCSRLEVPPYNMAAAAHYGNIGLFWNNRARPLALTTCISPARPAAGGWYW